jgi:hypothetical protein
VSEFPAINSLGTVHAGLARSVTGQANTLFDIGETREEFGSFLCKTTLQKYKGGLVSDTPLATRKRPNFLELTASARFMLFLLMVSLVKPRSSST